MNSQEHALRFSPGFRRSPNPDLAGDSKPCGGSVKPGSGGWPSPWAICWWLAGGSCQKQGAGEGVLYAHLPLVRLVNFSAKQFCYWLCLLSCLGLLECSVLTWPSAGDVPVTCWRGGYCPSQGGCQNTPGHWDGLKSTAGMFLRIQSHIYDIYYANKVEEEL